MRFKDVFSIIGPAMVGPSSSHTAGAARIGRAARQLYGRDRLPARAEIVLYGSFADTYKGHGTDMAIVGGLLDFATDDARLPRSLELAREGGMEVAFIPGKGLHPHPNTAKIVLYPPHAEGGPAAVGASAAADREPALRLEAAGGQAGVGGNSAGGIAGGAAAETTAGGIDQRTGGSGDRPSGAAPVPDSTAAAGSGAEPPEPIGAERNGLHRPAAEPALVMTGTSIGGGNIEIVGVNGFNVRFSGVYPALVVTHTDSPGVIADITQILKREWVNIGYMSVDRKSRAGDAMMVLELDSPIPVALVEELTGFPSIREIRTVELT